ncbi:zinc transport system substrate-binding protein [Eubacterium ruminantium]|uniref:Zinc transport system substrate-binding protein n=1 Tax=Eubacterium ruminantium TaxID=42322 RepID=A0A1T4NP29_9FIRM|nr:metal ABC transporter substrate-binding protein [Eubacterium ruminantium]SCW54539.1 zinc transport system substrate-binding protein [Eubacterium ruminantium]SDM90524.1 zinc transport system substrate-binding protein [Eubacterium ruminantium]SJZ80942.1 zinc transport system substrate-binding protein [Eubacterium ruminantium]
MKKRKLAAILTTMALGASVLSGCSKNDDKKDNKVDETKAEITVTEEVGTEEKVEDKYSIVCTTFPQYDWAKEVIGDKIDNYELTLLLDNGVDLHSYQPTVDDIKKIGEADMFIYVGGESDGWVDDALKSAENKDLKVINLLDSLGDSVKEEELKEGMQESEHEHDHEKDDDHDEAEEDHDDHDEAEEDHNDHDEAEEDHDDHDEAEEADHDDHDEDHDEDHDGGHHHEEGEVEYDEHVWLSLKNAKVLVNAIEGGIEEIDPANKDSYKTNADSYVAKLDELDKKYEEEVKNATNKTVVFGDRFPFRYLVDDYGIDYFAAFVGCSAESEASFETIAFLAGKIDELGLKTIFVIENSDKKIAETVKASTKSQDQSIVEINSLQSITSKDIEKGVTYLGTMEKNLEALSEGLK